MDQMKIGIIGMGSFASRRHVPALVDDPRCQVVAACRRDHALLTQLSDQFHIPERFTDWEEMLTRTRLDGVVIATPHDQHYRQARKALELGLHVLLEKPMALTSEDAADLLSLARSRGLCLLVSYNPPYWAHTGFLRDAIAGGGIGDLETAGVRWVGTTAAVFGKASSPTGQAGPVAPTLFRADPAVNGGGNFADVGTHLVSEILWVTGRKPLSVSALLDDASQDFRGAVTLRLEGDVTATITLVADSGYSLRRVGSVYDGAAGSLAATGMPFQVSLRRADGEKTLPENELPQVPSPASDWLTCVLSGAAPRGTAEHGLLVTQVVEAIYLSARKNRTVPIPARAE